MKLYGLFSYSYDYYEWEELECISRLRSRLEYYYHTHQESTVLIYGGEEEHIHLGNKEVSHYMIKEVKVV